MQLYDTTKEQPCNELLDAALAYAGRTSQAVSLFQGTKNPVPVRTATMQSVLDAIAGGTYKDVILQLRALRNRGETARYTALKGTLDAVTFAGVFAPRRAKDCLQAHTGILHYDLDHVDALCCKRALTSDPHIVYAFISPSGNGVKFGLQSARVSTDAGYKRLWCHGADYVKCRYGIEVDPSGKDVCRLCFLPWDPDVYFVPDALSIPPPPPASTGYPLISSTTDSSAGHGVSRHAAQRALKSATDIIDQSTLGNRHHARTRAAYLLGGYVAGGVLSKQEAIDALRDAVARNTEHLPQALQTIAECFEAGMAQPLTGEQKLYRNPLQRSPYRVPATWRA